MKKEKILSLVSKIYGILIAIFLLCLFGPKVFGSSDVLSKFPGSVINWNDNPTGFFLTFLIGYIIIWWKPLWGSLIIIAGALMFFIFNPHIVKFSLFILLPTVLVSVLYIWNWYYTQKKQI